VRSSRSPTTSDRRSTWQRSTGSVRRPCGATSSAGCPSAGPLVGGALGGHAPNRHDLGRCSTTCTRLSEGEIFPLLTAGESPSTADTSISGCVRSRRRSAGATPGLGDQRRMDELGERPGGSPRRDPVASASRPASGIALLPRPWAGARSQFRPLQRQFLLQSEHDEVQPARSLGMETSSRQRAGRRRTGNRAAHEKDQWPPRAQEVGGRGNGSSGIAYTQ